MKISLTKAGKRYNRDWIFRNLSYQFVSGTGYAIVGPNGSGKSTLLQAIAGSLVLSEGSIEYHHSNNSSIEPTEIFRSLAISAPYLELIEEMTVTEFLSFHSTFKPFLQSHSIAQIISLVGLNESAGKQIRYYSSGMKQRVKLAQAVFSDVPLILLDEPCTNLDSSGIELYKTLISDFAADRLIIVSSNDENEYGFCSEKINILSFK
ncbi:MAG: ATP-binding cassette domain-containing protein [Chitinophagaceae bacterium]|nr:ATP-binding cassette domain-containing protein [Chitinophagaceae bacterium]